MFNDFSESKVLKRLSRFTSISSCWKFNRSIGNIVWKPVFLNGNCIDEIFQVTKRNNITVRSPTKLTPIQTAFRKVEDYVYNCLLDERKEPRTELGDLVQTKEKSCDKL